MTGENMKHALVQRYGPPASTSKVCLNCNRRYFRTTAISRHNWAMSRYCSKACVSQARKRPDAELAHERLVELLSYDPETGVFTHASDRPKIRKGAIVRSSSAPGEYPRIKVDGRIYKAHRLAFFYMTKRWPTELIDHANGDRADNRWANLREATHQQNMWNAKPRKDGLSKLKGVCFNRSSGKWVAAIRINKKRVHLGSFETEEDASTAYSHAAKQTHGDFVWRGLNV